MPKKHPGGVTSKSVVPVIPGARLMVGRLAPSIARGVPGLSFALGEGSAAASGGGGGGGGSPGVQAMPPLTSLTNSEGVWTFDRVNPGDHLLLNGVWDGVTGGASCSLMGDTMTLNVGDGRYYIRNNYPNLQPWYLWDSDPVPEYIAPAPTFVGPIAEPDIWSLEMVDQASINALAGYTVTAAGNPSPFAFNPEFGTDSLGIKYLRFTNNPAKLNVNDDTGSTFLFWWLPIQPGVIKGTRRTSMYTRHLIWFEDDIAAGFQEVGMKLPGPSCESGFPPDFTGELVSGRTFHKLPIGGTYQASSYRYDVTQASQTQYPQNPDYGVSFKTGRWYVVVTGWDLNSCTNGVGNPDGRWRQWINGNLVFDLPNYVFRNDPNTQFLSFMFNFYHGGHGSPKGVFHYRVAKLGMSSQYIGVPAELLGSSPAWAVGKAKDTINYIANTAAMAGNLPGPYGGAPVTGGIGKSSADINSWGGFAADKVGNKLWGVAIGGDKLQWSNKVWYMDLNLALPQFTTDFLGTTENVATVQTPGNATYYTDGLPKARQSYFNNYYLQSKGGVIMVVEAAQFCNAAIPGSATMNDVMDFYNTSTHSYAPAGTYPTNGVASGLTNGLVHSCAIDPVTEEIYVSDNALQKKWSPATGNWTVFRGASGGTFRGSVIDKSRNRLMWGVSSQLICWDLTTAVQTIINVSGPAEYLDASNGDYLALIHDTDNDRYLHFTGNDAEGRPGKLFQIHPVTGVCTKIADIDTPTSGWNTRVHFFPLLHVVVWLSDYNANVGFMPTRNL